MKNKAYVREINYLKIVYLIFYGAVFTTIAYF